MKKLSKISKNKLLSQLQKGLLTTEYVETLADTAFDLLRGDETQFSKGLESFYQLRFIIDNEFVELNLNTKISFAHCLSILRG